MYWAHFENFFHGCIDWSDFFNSKIKMPKMGFESLTSMIDNATYLDFRDCGGFGECEKMQKQCDNYAYACDE